MLSTQTWYVDPILANTNPAFGQRHVFDGDIMCSRTINA